MVMDLPPLQRGRLQSRWSRVPSFAKFTYVRVDGCEIHGCLLALLAPAFARQI